MSEINEEQTEPTAEVEETEEQDTFPRAYVESLRAEAAEHRTGRTAAEERSEAALSRLRLAAIHSATRDVLADPTDLQWSDDMTDEEGWPDAEKISAAASALVEAKPHLGRVRGDVGQGYRSTESTSVDLAGMLRAGA